MRRREALKWMGTAAAGILRSSSDNWMGMLQAQTASPDWSNRVASLPRPPQGEVLLTAVGDMIISTAAAARTTPQAQQIYRVLRDADVAFGNCEQAIASVGYIEPKASVMGWPPILDDFKAAGFDMLALANNHYMDLGEAAALQGLEEIRKRGFTFAGGGKNLEEALTPGIFNAKGLRIGLLAFWCSPATMSPGYMDFARASKNKPGVAIITGFEVSLPDTQGPASLMLPQASDIKMLAEAVGRARPQVDFLMVSFHMHWGSGDRNQVQHGRKLICHAAVDAGADLVIGHGPHVLNAVEVYRGKPILYSLGHFYFQVLKDGKSLSHFMQSPAMVTNVENNYNTPEHRMSAIARMFVRAGRVTKLDLLPVTVDVQKDGNPSFANETEGQKIMTALQNLSKPYGTEVRSQGWYSEVLLA